MAQLHHDPFEAILAIDPEEEIVASPNALDVWLDFLESGRLVPLSKRSGIEETPRNEVAGGSYCLIGEYINGERDGAVPLARKNANWTPAQIKLRDWVIASADSAARAGGEADSEPE